MAYPDRPGRGGGGPDTYTGARGRRDEGAAAVGPLSTAAPLYKPLTHVEIVGAVPAGSRRERRQGVLLRAFLAQPELDDIKRSDFRGHVLEVWRFLVRWAFTGDGTTMPVRSRLTSELGISDSTWKRCRRWIERHGWLGTVRRGFTPALRPMALADDDAPNEAAVYVLAVPLQKAKPSRPSNDSVAISDPLTRTPSVTDPSYGTPKSAVKVKTGKAAADAATHYRRHVAVVRQGPVRTCSDRWVAWVTRPFLRAGYTPADLYHVVHHDPADGRHRGDVAKWQNPAAALAWRLSRWLDDPDRAWAQFRERGRWPDDVVPVASPAQRQWRDVKPIGDAYVERNRAKAAAAASTGPSAAWREARAALERRPRRGGRRD